jgi:hypothetical protein
MLTPPAAFAIVTPRERRRVNMVIPGWSSRIQCHLIQRGVDTVIFGGIRGC